MKKYWLSSQKPQRSSFSQPGPKSVSSFLVCVLNIELNSLAVFGVNINLSSIAKLDSQPCRESFYQEPPGIVVSTPPVPRFVLRLLNDWMFLCFDGSGSAKN